MNTLKGELQIELKGEKRSLIFNMNTFRILEKIHNVELGDLGDMALKKPFDFYPMLIHSAMVNEHNYNGLEINFTYDQVASWVGDIMHDQKVLEEIQEAMSNSLNLGKKVAEPESPHKA